MGRRGGLLSACGRAVYAQASLRGWHFRPSLPHQAEDSLPAGGTLGRDWRALQGGGCGLLLRRRRGFQAGFERPWGGIRAGLEGVSLLVAQRRDDRGFVGSRLGSRMEERRGCGAVDGGGAYLPRRAPSDRSEQETNSDLAPASVAEVVRLFGLRMWVEQSYKQVKHALGWSQYQVRSDLAIRRHWQLVCLAFSFCWWAYGRLPASLEEQAERTQEEDLPAESVEGGKKETSRVVAGGVEGGEGVARALCNASAILEGVHRSAPAQRAKSAA